MKKILFSLIALTFTFSNFALAGEEENKKDSEKSFHSTILSGKILDKDTNEELVCAYITIEGTDIKTATDIDGSFTIKGLEPGEYDLRVSYISYKDKIIEDVKLSSGKESNLSIKLNQVD
jgi:hypothetical protein